MKKVFVLAAAVSGALLAGCVAPVGYVEVPAHRPVIVTSPPAPVILSAPAPYAPVYAPEVYDRYVAVAVDADIEFVAGDTFIWFVGADGVRQRHFYAHGDHRHELFSRREALRAEAHRRGAPPVHMDRHEGPAHREERADNWDRARLEQGARSPHANHRNPEGLRPDEEWRGPPRDHRF